MKIIGKITDIKESQQVSDSFKKRNFVVEYIENPQYPYAEYISFELIQDRCELLDTFQVGQEVEVSFNLKGRKWISPEGEAKYFNSLQAWRIESSTNMGNISNTGNTFNTGNTREQKPITETSTTNATINEVDDLPF